MTRFFTSTVALIFTAVLTLTALSTHGQTIENKNWLLEQKLPDWAIATIKKLKLDSAYKISDFINPYYIQADFNGDNKQDMAIAIEQIRTKKKGIIILHNSTDKFFVLGAGISFGNGGDSFEWMDIWKVYTDNKIEPGVGETEIINLKANGIYVEKSEAASAVIYWTDDKYKWHQQGD